MKFISTRSFRLLVLSCICSFSFCVASARQDTVIKKDSLGKNGNPKILFGQASFYANKFNGRRTASGEIFRQTQMTCASNKIKLGTWIRVTNISNGRAVVVKVNDRLHRRMKRLIDLTTAAAKKLGFNSSGLIRVKVELLGKNKPVS